MNGSEKICFQLSASFIDRCFFYRSGQAVAGSQDQAIQTAFSSDNLIKSFPNGSFVGYIEANRADAAGS